MVEWSRTYKEKISVDLNFWSNGHAQNTINERRPYIFVEWLCAKGRINEKGPYTFVEWSC